MTSLAVRLALAAALLALASATAVPGGRLNKYVMKFEALDVMEQHVLRRRSARSAPQLHTGAFSVELKAFGSTFTLDLAPDTQVFASTMNTTIVSKSGRVWSMDDRRFYRGTVRNMADSFVHVRIALDGTMHGHMYCEGEAYAIEPAEYHFDHPVDFRHVIYRLSDHDPQTTAITHDHETCRAASPNEDFDPMTPVRHRRAAFNPSNTVCHIALVADFQFFSTVGGNDLAQTVEKMTTRFASVQELFQTDNTIVVQSVQIGISIGSIEVVDDNTDTRFVVSPIGDGVPFLEKFSETNWEAFCLAHLFTNHDFDNGLLGLAWVGRASSSPGGICQKRINSGGLKFTNTGFSTQVNFGSAVPDLTAFLVMAHELGHNFGSDHDSNSGSSNGNFLMFPVSVDGSQPNNYLFSSQSLTSIRDVIEAKGGCFQASGAELCSNGVQEGAEECDCGTASICPSIDACCEVFDPVNTANNCQLKSSSACTPFDLQNGACCTDSCTIKSDSTVCREETECTQEVVCSSGACADATDFPDNTICSNEFPARMCQAGRCQKSICEIFSLTDELTTGADACKVTCTDGTTLFTTDELTVNNDIALNRTTGSSFTPSNTEPILRAPGDQCKLSATEFGLCDSTGTCKEADGGKTAFDEIEDFIRNLSVSDALNWLQRTDSYIPNYGWVAIGVGVFVILVATCCYCSNKSDRKRGIV